MLDALINWRRIAGNASPRYSVICVSVPHVVSSPVEVPATTGARARGLRDISGQQWKSATAAWLGWFFDGLDMHLYLLVAPFLVAELIQAASPTDPAVTRTSGWIQAAFLAGWALGGGLFGRIGDLLGRARALSLTILTYALFTGLSSLATTWWQLLIFRFVAALGIGGEWAVGASLLSETWPKHWRPWIAAVLQTAVNVGVVLASTISFALAKFPPRYLFLVGVLPALVVWWIRRAVPEPQEWQAARRSAHHRPPPLADLFAPGVGRITCLTIIVCAASLTAWWAFMFWSPQQITHLPELAGWTASEKRRLASVYFFLLIGVSIPGNFFAGWLATLMGFRKAIAVMLLGFFGSQFGAYIVARDHVSLLLWTPWVGFFSGVFGLFTMYLPPLFPTLLRTTGAGFSYNIGRLAAAAGTVIFGMSARIDDFRIALLFDSFLFIPAMAVALLLPELRDSSAESLTPPGGPMEIGTAGEAAG